MTLSVWHNPHSGGGAPDVRPDQVRAARPGARRSRAPPRQDHDPLSGRSAAAGGCLLLAQRRRGGPGGAGARGAGVSPVLRMRDFGPSLKCFVEAVCHDTPTFGCAPSTKRVLKLRVGAGAEGKGPEIGAGPDLQSRAQHGWDPFPRTGSLCHRRHWRVRRRGREHEVSVQSVLQRGCSTGPGVGMDNRRCSATTRPSSQKWGTT